MTCEWRVSVLFESIVLKVDELDGSLRQFFENIKKYVSYVRAKITPSTAPSCAKRRA